MGSYPVMRDEVQSAIDDFGQIIELRRRTGPSGSQQYHAVTTRAVVRKAQDSGLPGEQSQTVRHVTIGYRDIDQKNWPGPPLQGDRVLIDGKELTVTSVESRKVGDDVARYEMTVKG